MGDLFKPISEAMLVVNLFLNGWSIFELYKNSTSLQQTLNADPGVVCGGQYPDGGYHDCRLTKGSGPLDAAEEVSSKTKQAVDAMRISCKEPLARYASELGPDR